MSKQLARLLGLGAAAMTLFIGLYFCWMLFWPVKTLTLSVFIPNTRGSSLTYHVNYCRYTQLPGTVSRELLGINGSDEYFAFPPVQTVVRPGCRHADIPFTLPRGITPGEYVFREVVVFQVNPLRSVTVHASSNAFSLRP